MKGSVRELHGEFPLLLEVRGDHNRDRLKALSRYCEEHRVIVRSAAFHWDGDLEYPYLLVLVTP